MNSSTLIQKVWNFCHTLRDDGVGYGNSSPTCYSSISRTNIPPNKPTSLIHPPSSAVDAER